MTQTGMRNPVGMGRVCTVLLGAVVVGIGLYAHFTSAWSRYNGTEEHKICYSDAYTKYKEDYTGERGPASCPLFGKEIYFVVITTSCFIISVLGLLLSTCVDIEKSYNTMDLGYHYIAAALLLVGGCAIILSAEQVKVLYDQFLTPLMVRRNPHFHWPSDYKLQRGWKIAAGSLTLVESLVYGTTAVFIGRRSPQ